MTIASKAAEDITIAVAGSTGYIGKFVAMECVRRGYKTIALTRRADAAIEGAETVVTDVTDPASIEAALAGRKVSHEKQHDKGPHHSLGILTQKAGTLLIWSLLSAVCRCTLYIRCWSETLCGADDDTYREKA